MFYENCNVNARIWIWNHECERLSTTDNSDNYFTRFVQIRKMNIGSEDNGFGHDVSHGMFGLFLTRKKEAIKKSSLGQMLL